MLNRTSNNGFWRGLAATTALVVTISAGAWVLTDQREQLAREEYRVEAALPHDVLFHLSLDGGAGHEYARDLAIYQLFEEPQMKAFAKPIREFLEQMASEGGVLEEIGLIPDDVKALLHGGLTITVVDVALAENGEDLDGVDVVATLDVGGNPELLRKVRELVENGVRDGIGVEPQAVEIGGRAGRVADLDGVRVLWTNVDNHIVLGTNENTLSGVIGRLTNRSRAGGMLENASVVAAWKRTVPEDRGVAFAYVDFERLWGVVAASPLGAEPAVMLIGELSGITSVHDIAYGLSFEGRAVMDRFYVGTPEGGQGLLAHSKPHSVPLRTLSMAPRDCFVYEGWRYDLGPALLGLRESVAALDEDMASELDYMLDEVKKETGISIVDDLIPALGEEMGFWIGSAPFGGMVPEMICAVELRDKQKLQAALDKLQTSLGSQAPLHSFTFADRKIGYFDVGSTLNDPGDFGFGLKPCWTIDGDFLLLALAPQTLKNHLVARDGQRLGIGEHNDFVEGMTHIWKHTPGAGHDAAAFIDLRRLVTSTIDTLAPIAQSIDFPDEVPIDLTQFPTTDVFRRHLFGLTAATRYGEKATTTEISSPMGYIPSVLVGAAAVGLPAFGLARMSEARDAASFEAQMEQDRARVEVEQLRRQLEMEREQLQRAKQELEKERQKGR